MISADQLRQIMPHAGARVGQFIGPLNEAMQAYDIFTPMRQAAFLAQIAHESCELRYTEEIASGAAYDTGPKAVRLGNTPEEDGDGEMYKGRGLIQLTGLTNYKLASDDLGYDFVFDPDALHRPEWAALSAAWFWHKNHLNSLADQGHFRAITKAVNGGYNGLAEREAYYDRAKRVLGA